MCKSKNEAWIPDRHEPPAPGRPLRAWWEAVKADVQWLEKPVQIAIHLAAQILGLYPDLSHRSTPGISKSWPCPRMGRFRFLRSGQNHFKKNFNFKSTRNAWGAAHFSSFFSMLLDEEVSAHPWTSKPRHPATY